MNWLKNAFAIEQATDLRLSAAETAVVERLVDVLRRRELLGPALLLLQSSIPLQFVVGQFLLFLEPVARLLLAGDDLRVLVGLLQRRGSFEHICRMLEDAAASHEVDS